MLSLQAIPLAIFLLIEEDVEEIEDEHLKALFVEAFGDREHFFNICIKELEKSEAIIELHMDRTNLVERSASVTDDNTDEPDEEYIQETQEDKINVLLDLFKDKDLVSLTKYIKVFNQNNRQILGVAHAKMNSDYNRLFKKLQLEPDEEDVKHIKSFTKPNVEQISGKGCMVATSCKIFYIKKFSRQLQDTILSLFSMEPIDDMLDEDSEEALAASQDFPEFSQSRTMSTLRICTICKFKTRNVEEYEDHMGGHQKCKECGLYFENETSLKLHDKSFHACKTCDKCGKEVLEINYKKHMNAHNIERGYSKVVSRGKVKASKSKAKPDDASVKEKEKPSSGYRYFLRMTRPKLRNENPDASPQEMIKLLNTAWNIEKENGKKKHWENAAKEATFEASTVVTENVIGETLTDYELLPEAQVPVQVQKNHSIKKCTICNLMIANVENHMRLHESERESTIETVVVEDPIEEDLELEEAAADAVVDSDPVEEDIELEEAATDATSPLSIGQIVLVQRKSLHWPAKIAGISSKSCEVIIFDKARTQDNKQMKFIIPFTTDQAICEGRSSVWVKAWKEAKAEFEAKK